MAHFFAVVLALTASFPFTPFEARGDDPSEALAGSYRVLKPLEPVAAPSVIDSAAFRDQILGTWDYVYTTDGFFRRRLPTAYWGQLGARLVFERIDEERVVKPLFFQIYYHARRGKIFEGIRYRIVDSTKPPRWRNDTCYPMGHLYRDPPRQGVELMGWCDSDKSHDPVIHSLVGDTLVCNLGDGKLTFFRRQ